MTRTSTSKPAKRAARLPRNNREWQEAVDLAEAYLHLDAARLYGLVSGGPDVNPQRCAELLRLGQRRGITPAPDAIERFVQRWNVAANEQLRRTPK